MYMLGQGGLALAHWQHLIVETSRHRTFPCPHRKGDPKALWFYGISPAWVLSKMTLSPVWVLR
jgi:hypothetical protein